jgi:hypothetical protein
MLSIRIPAIVAIVSIFLLGTPVGAVERCNLVAGYMLEHEEEPEFGVSIYRCADFWKLELEQFQGRSASGEARWRVLDSIQLLDVSSGEVVVSETCRIGASPDRGIVAIAEQMDELEFSRIRAAWRADKLRARWIPIDPTSVECWNESAGLSSTATERGAAADGGPLWGPAAAELGRSPNENVCPLDIMYKCAYNLISWNSSGTMPRRRRTFGSTAWISPMPPRYSGIR